MSNNFPISKMKIKMSNDLPELVLNSKKSTKKNSLYNGKNLEPSYYFTCRDITKGTTLNIQTRLFANYFIDYNTVKPFRCNCIKLHSSVSNISAKHIFQYA
ncbi:hypothetical protein GIB67_020798 [Kingdonia uniflora]|uniref:Uncharacterized protein n=1 Tax=Kingdonia uniflora TaxID=39325 RepID=A0A7J7M760_9MAGN|nr:hypothetical protein GIB67_020798 [Kingdonia uniflora]